MENLIRIPLPNLKFPSRDEVRYDLQGREGQILMGLGHTSTSGPILPKNNRNVLQNMMMTTSSWSSKLLKHKSKIDGWWEDELDFLWVGVHGHEQRSWDAMLIDSSLRFSDYGTSEDLAAQWAEEQVKILGGSAFPGPKSTRAAKPTKSSLFPGCSSSQLLPEPSRGLNLSHLKEKDEAVGSSSSKDKLPRWLREAVNAPMRPAEPDLPPTVPSVDLEAHFQYGQEKPRIPPFLVPGSTPSRPNYPPQGLKKRKSPVTESYHDWPPLDLNTPIPSSPPMFLDPQRNPSRSGDSRKTQSDACQEWPNVVEMSDHPPSDCELEP